VRVSEVRLRHAVLGVVWSPWSRISLRFRHMTFTVEQATQRLLDLLDRHDGYLDIERIEDDEVFAENRDVVSAAARALLTDPTMLSGEETHLHEHWFPYSFLLRSTS
jgi:hypothetical protein